MRVGCFVLRRRANRIGCRSSVWRRWSHRSRSCYLIIMTAGEFEVVIAGAGIAGLTAGDQRAPGPQDAGFHRRRSRRPTPEYRKGRWLSRLPREAKLIHHPRLGTPILCSSPPGIFRFTSGCLALPAKPSVLRQRDGPSLLPQRLAVADRPRRDRLDARTRSRARTGAGVAPSLEAHDRKPLTPQRLRAICSRASTSVT